MSVLLPYDILYRTSEDAQHPVTQLAGGSGEVKRGETALAGWQSARNGKAPQTLVLRFHGNVWLEQLRILSHESKIATKVEVRVAKLTAEDDWQHPPSFRHVRFAKLGSVDFNSNEQSNYKSKERKTVHLKTEVYFLKLLFDRPYINSLNTGQQIGIYALECNGRVTEALDVHADEPVAAADGLSRCGSVVRGGVGRDSVARPSAAPAPAPIAQLPAAEPRPGRPSLGSNSVGDRRPSKGLASSTPPLSSGFVFGAASPAHTAPSGAFRSVRILEFEDFFLRRSEELVALKEEAVAVEDYHVAAECRDKLTLLNGSAKDIYELEQDKVQAIIDEDFEAAQQVKVRMNALVERLFSQTALPTLGFLAMPDEAAAGRGGEAATKEEQPPDRSEEEDEEMVPPTPLLPAPSPPQPLSRPASPPPPVSSASSKDPGRRRTPSQPTRSLEAFAAADDAENVSNASEAIEVTSDVERAIDAEKLEPRERAVAREILSSAGNEEDTTVMLAPPGFDIQPLIASVGTFTVACLLSKRFKLREAALVVLTEHIGMFRAAPPQIEDAVLRFLDANSCGLQDSIPNVVFAACTFVRMVLHDEAGCIGGMLTPLVALLPRLVTRCSDNLQRIRDEALTTLTLYVRTPAISVQSMLPVALMEPMDRERRKLPFTNAKAQLARLQLFQLLVESERLHVEGSGSNSDAILQKLLLPTVNHANPEVRDLAVSLLGKLVASRQVTLRDKDLAKVTNPGIRDAIAAKRP